MTRPPCPTLCTSAYCGEVDCPPDCSQLPELEAWRAACLAYELAQEEEEHPQAGHLSDCPPNGGWGVLP